MTKYFSKFKLIFIFITILGLTFVTEANDALALSGEPLQLQIKYLAETILTDYWLIFLVTVSSIISIFFILSAIKGSDGYENRFKEALILVILVGLIFGILKSITFIISNRYLQYKMFYLISYVFSSVLNNFLLAALGTVIFVFIAIIIVSNFLRFLGTSSKVTNIISCGIIPSLLIFIIVGYWINKVYLPGFLGLNSIIGNAVLIIICLLLGFVIGWVIIRASQINYNFPRLYSLKTSVGILVLVLLFNGTNFIYYSSIKAERPNIILISIDTLRADHLSCYGYHRNTTPNIDGFAKDAVLFTNTIAQSSWTLPSHMSMLTGLYPSGHGVMRPSNKLSDQRLTIAEILQNAGYKTIAFTDGAYLSRQFGYQGFDRFDDAGNGIETIYGRTINWLRRSNTGPFFLFLHTYQVHAPYDPPHAYDIYSNKNYRGIVKVSGSSNDYYKEIKPQMTLEDYYYVIDKYDGEIYYTDHYLGLLFKELKDLEIYDNSIIILTSDHGENFLDHPAYNIDHKELYDEIVKVPLIIKAPMFPTDQIITTQVESIDIMPTVLEQLGISLPSLIEGKSLVGLVQTGTYDKSYAFSERNYQYKMIRSNDWKLMHRSETKLELFDIKNDPGERSNLLVDNREIAKSMYEKLEDWMDIQKERSMLFTAEKIKLDNELTQKLKALGYLN